MKHILNTLFACGLLTSSAAVATGAITPPQGRQAQSGACALVLRQPSLENQASPATPPQTGKKFDFDSWFTPCRMSDMERADDIAENDGKPPEDRYGKIDEWMALNRQQGTEAEHAFDWKPSDDDRQSSVEIRSLPAVPEPETYAMWLAGMTVLAAVGTRRRLQSSAGKGPPTARR